MANLTAMYEYYQNGPLPTWIGWYLQHLPHWFHIATAGLTLAMELLLVWMAFLGRRARIICFFVVTAWQIGVIATANYAFLNYLVLVLAVLLLDDALLVRILPQRWRKGFGEASRSPETVSKGGARRELERVAIGMRAVVLLWIGYATTLPLLQMFWREVPLPDRPVALLDPLRIANQYGLFAVMTPHRYEIEFQGSENGTDWVAYRFRYKPQAVNERPRIYAPYQPRFDWNLWFASLGEWRQYPFVPRTEDLLLENDAAVLRLFDGNPFPGAPPRFVRAVLWQYWFSTPEQKRMQGVWWTRQLLGSYAPTLVRLPEGGFALVEGTDPQPSAGLQR